MTKETLAEGLRLARVAINTKLYYDISVFQAWCHPGKIVELILERDHYKAQCVYNDRWLSKCVAVKDEEYSAMIQEIDAHAKEIAELKAKLAIAVEALNILSDYYHSSVNEVAREALKQIAEVKT